MPSDQGHAPAGTAKPRERLLTLLRPVVEAAGYDIDDITVTSAGRRSVVRVVVDTEGGIDLDAVAEVSRLVSEALDAEDDGFAGSGAYTLEVTSPGVDRPLTEPRHWRRAVGRLVAVEIAGKPATVRIVEAGDRSVTVRSGDTDRAVPYTDLGKGRVQVEFNRATSAGKSAKSTAIPEEE